MIVNTFIITPKQEWRDATCLTTYEAKGVMAHMLPDKYRTLFKSLVKDSLNEVMDNRDHKKAYSLLAEAMLAGGGEAWYAKNTGDCLLHVVRKTFYDTLMILRGDYNPCKYDYVIVTLSRDVISEKIWQEGFTGKSYSRTRNNGHVLVGNFPRNA